MATAATTTPATSTLAGSGLIQRGIMVMIGNSIDGEAIAPKPTSGSEDSLRERCLSPTEYGQDQSGHATFHFRTSRRNAQAWFPPGQPRHSPSAFIT